MHLLPDRQPIEGSKRDDEATVNKQPDPPDPTPEQIRSRAEKIRRKWSERVRESRRRLKLHKWSVPVIEVAEIERDPGRR